METLEISSNSSTWPKVAPQRRSVSEPPQNFTPLSDTGVGTAGSSQSSPCPSHRQVIYSQPTCPICLEDFESHRTLVRELPCWHIYHPPCIDTFLLENSSLCPVCKKRVLEKNFCPENITNAMVRSERHLRRRQGEASGAGRNDGGSRTAIIARPVSVGRRHRQMASFHRQFGRAGSGGGRSSTASAVPNAAEMSDRATFTNNAAPADVSSHPTVDSPEWRGRVRALVHQPTIEDEDRERRAGMSRCKIVPIVLHPRAHLLTASLGRKALGSVFPGFH